MENSTLTQPASTIHAAPLRRESFLALLHTAVGLGETRFARQASLSWLAAYPGDLPVRLLLAKAYLAAGLPEQALPVLDEICQEDPEYTEAVELRWQAEAAISYTSTHPRGDGPDRPAGSAHGASHPSESEQITSLDWLSALGKQIGTPAKGAGTALAEEKAAASWARSVAETRGVLSMRSACQPSAEIVEHACQILNQALIKAPDHPLTMVTHLELLEAQGSQPDDPVPTQAVRDLAEHYLQRSRASTLSKAGSSALGRTSRAPLQVSLVLAQSLMESGDTERAVALLHEAASRDVTGQAAERLWGRDHPYRALWPERLEQVVDIAVPASVARVLGWNRLPARVPNVISSRWAGKNGNDSSSDQGQHLSDTQPAQGFDGVETAQEETLRSVQTELERIAARLGKPGLARADMRFPIYVLLTTRAGLASQYGEDALPILDDVLNRLSSCVNARHDWHSLVFYADQGLTLHPIEAQIRPARQADPWSIKLALADLDEALARRGEMIGAVLIVGGPEVVPFHHLPNPVDDVDLEVPSDNPYGTRDDNYFIPEWPVGRLPGGAGRDPAPLVKALETLAQRHQDTAARQKRSISSTHWLSSWWQRGKQWLLRLASRQSSSAGRDSAPAALRRSFGYTAAIWQQASASVYQPIGEQRSMLVSPPVHASNGEGDCDDPNHITMPSTHLGYFNLHGVAEAAEWYGHAESTSPMSTPDYPVALRPQDVINSGRAPQVVFTEACYGAHVAGKQIDEALALKFLQSGSQAVVGSTCTSYGALNPPLIAADLLGHAFWDRLQAGIPAGEALRRAKIALAREMQIRQGYLDGEDQKTLIAFVLYGDPLAQPENISPAKRFSMKGISDTLGLQPAAGRIKANRILRSLRPPASLHTVCDRAGGPGSGDPLDPEVLAQVKAVVERYLPAMADACLTVSREHAACQDASHGCTLNRAAKSEQARINKPPTRSVVTLSKQVVDKSHLHRHYARLTLNQEGRVVKLVVSR